MVDHADLDHSGIAGLPVFVVSGGSVVASTSFANTDMAFSVAANTDYEVFCYIMFDTNATTVGIRIGFNGPASPNLIRIGGHVPTGAAGANDSTMGHGMTTAYDTTVLVTTSGPGATNAVALIAGVFQNGANAGTLTLRHASETATTTTIEAGSYMRLTKIS